MPNFNIMNRLTGNVLYTAVLPATSTNLLRDAVLAAQSAGVSLFGATLANGDLTGVSFAGANLRQVDFRNTVLQNACFDQCDMYLADLRGCDCTDASFDNVDMTNVDVRGAIGSFSELRRLKDRDYQLASVGGEPPSN